MRKLFLTTLVLISLAATAQTPQLISDTTKYYYCEILVTSKPISMQIEAAVIFNTDSPFWKDPEYSDLISKNNKMPTYNFPLDVINIMASKGWRYKDHYISSSQRGTERYLLEKPR